MSANKGPDRPGGRWRNPPDPPYDSLTNIHKDVHGLRKELLNAIEKSQTAVMNRLSAISAKIDRLSPPAGGDDTVTEENKAAMLASIEKLKALSAKAKALDEMTS